MYRLTVTLFLALASATCHGADASGLTLTLTDSATGQPVADAVIILDNGAKNAPIKAEIVQKNREFQPHTLVVPINSEVDFPNRDNTQHHVYSFSPAKIFDIELYAERPEEPVIFDQTGVVEIGCNIHDHMQGFILVTDSEPAGRTNERGRVTLRLPPATDDNEAASLSVWHPRMADNTRLARFTLTQPPPDSLELSIELSPEPASDDRLDGLQKRFREL